MLACFVEETNIMSIIYRQNAKKSYSNSATSRYLALCVSRCIPVPMWPCCVIFVLLLAMHPHDCPACLHACMAYFFRGPAGTLELDCTSPCAHVCMLITRSMSRSYVLHRTPS